MEATTRRPLIYVTTVRVRTRHLGSVLVAKIAAARYPNMRNNLIVTVRHRLRPCSDSRFRAVCANERGALRQIVIVWCAVGSTASLLQRTRILVDYGNDLYLIPIKTVFVLFLSFPFLPYRFSSPYRSWYSVLSYVFPKLEKFETNELVPIEVYIAVSGVGGTFARERDAIKPRKSVDESSMRGSLKMTLSKRRRNGKPMYEVE